MTTRGGQARLTWNAPNLAGKESLALSSPDFGNEGMIPAVHAAKRAGGNDLSPALTWSPVPDGTAQLLLVIEDPDAPTTSPYVHCVALLEPSLTSVPQGALNASYKGPAPIKGRGPHRYVFQLFALAKPVTAVPDPARPRDVLATAGDVLARGRLDGFYERA
jgi:phosphatidylethanolamine-binding protein (PEBP) family uncharacterized protein